MTSCELFKFRLLTLRGPYIDDQDYSVASTMPLQYTRLWSLPAAASPFFGSRAWVTWQRNAHAPRHAGLAQPPRLEIISATLFIADTHDGLNCAGLRNTWNCTHAFSFVALQKHGIRRVRLLLALHISYTRTCPLCV